MKVKMLWMTLTFGLGLSLMAQTSEDNDRLKKALERFPAADTNKDGVLSMAEATAFKEKQGGKGRGEKAKAGAAPAPKGGEKHVYKTIGKLELPLYVFNPAGHSAEAKAPAIVFFFGGGWKAGAPTQFEHHCEYFASRGMVAITVDYRVSSRHPVKVEDCVEDAKSAMRWVRDHAAKLGVDPDRIASGGGSAGGHLAACTALIDDFDAKTDNLEVSPKPNAMVLFNPAMGSSKRGDRESGRTRGPAEKVTPLTYAAAKQAPCIMFFGTADGLLEGAELFRQQSVEAGNSCQIETYEGQGHGFFNHGAHKGKYYELTLAAADKFLVDLKWLSAPPKGSGN